MGLSSSAIIVVVLISALVAVSTAAGIIGVLNPDIDTFKFPSSEQLQHMRTVREIHFDLIAREAGIKIPNFEEGTGMPRNSPGIHVHGSLNDIETPTHFAHAEMEVFKWCV